MTKNYYDILGVKKDASQDEIKKAFRKLAHQYHPDKSTGDESKFKEINEAYQVLSNVEKRKQYDQFGRVFEGGVPGGGAGFGGFNPADFQNWGDGFNGNFSQGDFGDIFETIFQNFGGGSSGTRRKTYRAGSDIEYVEMLTLEEVFAGVKKNVTFRTQISCGSCGGLGYDEKKGFSTCAKCGGKGEIRVERKTFFGNFSQVTACDECSGRGEIPKEKCKECGGKGRIAGTKDVHIEIAPGIEDGQIMKIKGGGEAGERGGGSGDLYVIIRVKPHETFQREKSDLFIKKEIKITDALLEKEISMKDISGENITFKVPAGFGFDKPLKITGKGMPYFGSSSRGDLYISITLKTPKKLSRKAKEILEKLDGEI